MSTAAAVEPPNPETVDAYRVAVLAYRKAWRENANTASRLALEFR